MVTGGFRSRAAMEQALEQKAADVIGLGRPLCVITDAPKQLIEGREDLPRYEDRLDLIPGWLSFLKRFQTIKAINGFAGVYWFYEQLWTLGREGCVNENVPPFTAFRRVDARSKAIQKQRI
jgi:hypothetical protein